MDLTNTGLRERIHAAWPGCLGVPSQVIRGHGNALSTTNHCCELHLKMESFAIVLRDAARRDQAGDTSIDEVVSHLEAIKQQTDDGTRRIAKGVYENVLIALTSAQYLQSQRAAAIRLEEETVTLLPTVLTPNELESFNAFARCPDEGHTPKVELCERILAIIRRLDGENEHFRDVVTRQHNLSAKVADYYRWLVRDLTTALDNRNRERDALARALDEKAGG